MLAQLASCLTDPRTGRQLTLEVFTTGPMGEVVDGRLITADDGEWYRVENSIADLLPERLRDENRYVEFARRYNLGTAGRARAVPYDVTNQQTQIDFFKSDSVVYDNDVSNLPFYRMFDALYMHPWIANLPRNQLVLDIGGGTGRQSVPLATAGHRVLSCDISEEMLSKAVHKARSENLMDRVAFLLCDAENLPVANAEFDCAICYGALHHMAAPEQAVRHAARVMKPGGRWFSVDPHDSPLRFIFEAAMKIRKLYDEVAADENHFRGTELRGICAGAGIDVHILYSTYVLPHMTNMLPYRFGLMLLKATDRIFQNIPALSRVGGIVVAEGLRR